MIDQTSTTENSYLYAGEQFDANTGFYNLRARYMDPSMGRFISMDEYQGSIFDPVSLHKYLYANANPVMYTDPTGYFSLGEMSAASTVRGVINGIAVGGISGATINALVHFASGEEMTARVYWDGFMQGALYGGGFAGVSVLANKYLLASVVLASTHTWSTYSGISDGLDEFKDGNIMLSMVLIGSSLGGGKKPGKGSKSKGTDKTPKQTVTSNKGKTIDITPRANHSTTTSVPNPAKGTRNSSVDILDKKTGEIKTRRYYGADGRAVRDIDYTNHGNPKTHPEWPHEHIYKWNSDGTFDR